MVYDFQNFCLFYIVDSLRLLVVINKNQFLSSVSNQIPAGNRSHIFSFFIQNREITVPLVFHHLFDIIQEILCGKCN